MTHANKKLKVISNAIDGPLVTVYVTRLTGKTITYENISINSTSIQDIKNKISEETNYPVDQIRLIHNNCTLCPSPMLKDISKEQNYGFIQMYMTHRMGLSPVDQLITNKLNKIYVESFPKYVLHRILNSAVESYGNNWDINMSNIIYDYSPFIGLNVLIRDENICMRDCGHPFRFKNKSNFCNYCKRWLYTKPIIDCDKIKGNINKYQLKYTNENKNYLEYYGLFIKFEFKMHLIRYPAQMLIMVNIYKINKNNITEFVEIRDAVYETKLKYSLYDKGYVGGSEGSGYQQLTLKIHRDSLETQTVKSAFVNGKLKVNILIKEAELPVCINNLGSKGDIIGDINLEHHVYRL
eukprot:203452_1